MRPSWDQYFMDITDLVATRSTCLRRAVGAVIVKDRRILATGYNGAPIGIAHCIDDRGCLRQQRDIPSGEQLMMCWAAHAEQNAICQAARFGVSVCKATLYCSNYPCSMCAKIIVNSGIDTVIYKNHYNDELAKEILTQGNVVTIFFGDIQ